MALEANMAVFRVVSAENLAATTIVDIPMGSYVIRWNSRLHLAKPEQGGSIKKAGGS